MTARKLPVPLRPSERDAPLDYLSRLAFRNGRDSVRAICTDFGIRHGGVAAGEAGALADVEILGSVEPGTLSRNAFFPLGERMRVLVGGKCSTDRCCHAIGSGSAQPVRRTTSRPAAGVWRLVRGGGASGCCAT